MTSLREQLGGGRQDVPEFRLLLPAGWTIHDTSAATEAEMLAKARARLRDAHQPETYALLANQVTHALEAARRRGAFMMIAAGEEAPRWATVPVSILGSVTTGTADVPLDSLVADAVERRGARVLDGSRLFLRWAERRSAAVNGEDVGVYTVVYLTPVPGSQRAKAFQLTATLIHDRDTDPEQDQQMSAWLTLLDSCVVTFAWTGR